MSPGARGSAAVAAGAGQRQRGCYGAAAPRAGAGAGAGQPARCGGRSRLAGAGGAAAAGPGRRLDGIGDRHAAVAAPRVVGLAAGRQDLRLPDPVLLLDTALEAERLVEALDVGGGETRDVLEAADAQVLEPVLQNGIDAADAGEVVARGRRRPPRAWSGRRCPSLPISLIRACSGRLSPARTARPRRLGGERPRSWARLLRERARQSKPARLPPPYGPSRSRTGVSGYRRRRHRKKTPPPTAASSAKAAPSFLQTPQRDSEKPLGAPISSPPWHTKSTPP